MQNDSRTVNSVRNVAAGFGYQAILIFLSFLSRSIFIRALGMEYLGVNGFFSNVLSVLSLTDLGVGSAVIYSLYRPLSNNDTVRVGMLIRFYKKIYRYVAAAILVSGLTFLPFLHLFVETGTPMPNLALYYLLFLLNSVLSYLFIYKSTVIQADQKLYLIKLYSFLFQVVRFVFQTVILLVTGDYLLYLVIQLFCTLLNNICIAYKANRLYPYLGRRTEDPPAEEKKAIFTNIKSLFLYKLSGVILNNSANIIISKLIGTIWVGFYSNYILIVGSVQTFTDLIFTSVSASVGNLNAGNQAAEQDKVFRMITFVSFWIYGFCGICLFVLLDPFIRLWLGDAFCLGFPVLTAIVLNFLTPGMLKSVMLYRDTTGLFRETKYVIITTSIINLLLAILLERRFGLAGILFSAPLARLATQVWFEPLVIFRRHLCKSPKLYFLKQLAYTATTAAVAAMLYILCSYFGSGVFAFAARGAVCLAVPNLIFAFVFHKTEEYQFLRDKLIRYLLPILHDKLKPVKS